MSESLLPVQHTGSIPIGYSKPQLTLLSDGLTYAVKFKNNPSGTRVLVNEYVAARVAQLLSLPVPSFQIVHISDDFIKNNPALADHDFTSGHQFASLYIEGCTFFSADLLRTDGISITNPEVLPGMIVFDFWLSNTDRKEKNVLVKADGNGGHYIYMIDHGRCFADSNWTTKSLKEIKSRLNLKVHQWCFHHLGGKEGLASYVEQIVSLPEGEIRQIVQSIPQDWDVTAVEREALCVHLMKAREKLPAILAEFIKKTGSA
ncbi:HipA family kinase [Paenibacillus agricola]|uniref:HipA-like kinase domain-containing protein n=1 Tax=Paenibacillus agricola TaxID=2716264 RepID=A0ABX0J0J7_9BACL|nr:HipA family kinase [Paenibacillus agricola]NHN28990.1 hypothetical protein [Paenibacillus agricola]